MPKTLTIPCARRKENSTSLQRERQWSSRQFSPEKCVGARAHTRIAHRRKSVSWKAIGARTIESRRMSHEISLLLVRLNRLAPLWRAWRSAGLAEQDTPFHVYARRAPVVHVPAPRAHACIRTRAHERVGGSVRRPRCIIGEKVFRGAMQNRSNTEYLDCVVDWEFDDKIAERTVNVICMCVQWYGRARKTIGETRGTSNVRPPVNSADFLATNQVAVSGTNACFGRPASFTRLFVYEPIGRCINKRNSASAHTYSIWIIWLVNITSSLYTEKIYKWYKLLQNLVIL